MKPNKCKCGLEVLVRNTIWGILIHCPKHLKGCPHKRMVGGFSDLNKAIQAWNGLK